MHSIDNSSSAAAGGFQPGMVITAYESGTYPGFLKCDNSLIDPAIYPSLTGIFRTVHALSVPPLPNEWWVTTGTQYYAWSSSYAALDAYQYWTLAPDETSHSIGLQPADGVPVSVKFYSFDYLGAGVERLILSGSDDGVTWNALDTQQFENGYSGGGAKYFELQSPEAYLHHRIELQARSGWGIEIVGLRLYDSGEMRSRLVASLPPGAMPAYPPLASFIKY